jgi:uncharacterized protein YbjT (DUF2867 family)
MSVSVLIIGASGAFGQPLVQEFIRQRLSFKRIAVLAANEQKASKFASIQESGVEIIIGSFRDSKPYKGIKELLGRCCHS